MTYRDTLHRLAAASEAQALAGYRSYQEHDLDEAEFVGILAAFVAAANSRAAALADLSLALTLTAALGRRVPSLGLLPPADDLDRLHTAAETLLGTLDTTPDPEARVARLARSEPLETAARTYSEGVAASPRVIGWVRGVSGGACELCQSWAAGGAIFPPETHMLTHHGCSCIPNPVVK